MIIGTGKPIYIFKQTSILDKQPFPSAIQFEASLVIDNLGQFRDQLAEMQQSNDIKECKSLKISFRDINIYKCSSLENTNSQNQLNQIFLKLRHLAIQYEYSLKESAIFQQLVKQINLIEHLQTIQIVLQCLEKQEECLQWTRSLKIKPSIFKYQRIGRVTYQGSIPEHIINSLQQADPSIKYCTQIFDKNGQFYLVFPQIQSWQCIQLHYRSKTKLQSLKILQSIDFKNLFILDIAQNGIQSIQWLTHLQVSTLKRILLYKNQITSFQSLRKLNLTSLELVYVYTNFSKSAHSILQAYWPSLKGFSLQAPVSKCQSESINCLVKIRYKQSIETSMNIESFDRILQKQTALRLKQKNTNLSLYMTNGEFKN